ncbi:MAG: hypothetical protein OJF60_000085 [Burkholderiaceae bacterium]|jgi:CRISPR-associated protein Csx16|nr:MAG: hypothetical protein OJF60_000085 [Burkholderiaceae bacterium]
MTTWFVSRHPGALHWMTQHGPGFDRHTIHLDTAHLQPGDVVMGTLPVNLAAQVCARGAACWHLALALPAEARGRELGAEDLAALGANLQRFDVRCL